MNITEIVDMFNVAFEQQLIGGKVMTGLFTLFVVAYIALRGRLGIDAVVVILAPMVIYLAWYGYLPVVLAYLTLFVVGLILYLGYSKAST